jgi:serine/threonine-protein kinase
VGTLDNGAPFMVMEYLDGCDLAQWLRQSGPLSTEQTVEFVLQALEAIAEAHGLGIVHRDLKPGNLFCVRRSDGVLSIKVLDFGISKVTLGTPTAPQFDMTAPATIMGSPLYMSPEQMRSARDVDVRTDIWSIGVILYELLTGNPPFNGETISEVCVKTAASPPSPMRLSRPEIPVELEVVILKCLEKDRHDRYSNVAELAAALSAFAPRRARPSVERISRVIAEAGLGSSVFESPPNSERSLQPTAARTDANFLPAPPLRRLPSWSVMTGLFALGMLFVGLGLWWFRLRSSAPTVAYVAPAETVVPSVPGRAIPSSVAPLASEVTEAAQRSPKFEVGKPQRKSQPKVIQGKKAPAIDPFGSPH